VANRRISEFPAISGIDIDNQDLLTLVHVFEVNPTLRNKKLTFTEFRSYLDQYYANTSGATISGNVTITGNLSVSGTSTFNAITATGASTFSGIVVQNNATVSGTISGATITGNALQSTTLNAGTVTTTTATGTTALFTSGLYQTLSGATITGNNLSATSGVFTALSGTTITGTTVAATTGSFQTLSTPVLNVSGNLSVASGLTVTGVAQFTNGVQVTGTLSGTTLTGTTAQFTTVTGVTGVYTTLLSGATITGNTARFSNVTGVSGVFTTSVSGATVTGNTGAFGNISGISGVFTQVLSGAFITGNTGNYTTLTGVSGTFANLSGTTITGTNVNATTVSGVSGVFTSRVSGTTITGTSGLFSVVNGVSGTFTTRISGSTVTGDNASFTRVTGITGTFTTIVSGLTVTGNTGAFTNLTGIAGVFTTSVSGATVTGNTVQGTSGVFVNLSGTTITGTTVNAATGVFNTLQATNLAFTNTTVSGDLRVLGSGFFSSGVQITGTLSGTTITGTTVQSTTGTFVSLTGTTVQSTTGTFVSLTGTTTSGTTANFVSGVFSTQISGVTVTGTTANFTSGNFTNISGGTHTITSGVFASGTAANPSISFVSDQNTGIYAPGANQVAISTDGTGRLFVTASGNVGINTASPSEPLNVARLGSDLIARFGTLETNAGAWIRLQGKDATGASNQFWDIRNNVDGSLSFNGNTSLLTERARIDSSGRLLVGTTTSFGDAAIVQSIGTNAYTFQGFRFGGDNGLISLGSAAGTQASPSILTTGNLNLGGIVFRSYDSAAYRIGAQITAVAESEWASADCPTRLVFSTTADGASSPTERMRISNAGTTTLTSAVSTAPFIANIGAIEVARLDTNGRLLLGVSTGIVTSGGFTPGIQVAANASAAMSAGRYSNTTSGPSVVMQKSRNATVGAHTIVNSGDILGNLTFEGSDGSAFIGAAAIVAQVDGTPGTNNMPGRIVLLTTPDGTAASVERFRITNDGVIVHDQPAPAAVNATATLTVANLKTGIITSTSAAATDMTLPTGTDTQAGFVGTYDNFTFEWSVINTGPSLVRVLAGTAHTIVGSGSVATGTSGRFASRRTAANTFVTYRLS
jgi:hypothetical protein